METVRLMFFLHTHFFTSKILFFQVIKKSNFLDLILLFVMVDIPILFTTPSCFVILSFFFYSQ